MTVRTHAEATSVPIAKSRTEIDKLLKEHGVLGVQWTDNHKDGITKLGFVIEHAGAHHMVRFVIRTLPDAVLMKDCHLSSGRYRERAAWLVRERDQRNRQAYRVVLGKLRNDFAMVHAGLATMVEVFLPFVQNTDGRSLAEVVVPELPAFFGGASAQRLLGG